MAEMELVYLSPHELTPYEGNTRKHTPTDIEGIKRSIKAAGFRDPIGIWGKQNLIIEGHGRQIAAIELGLDKAPCIRLDDMTDVQRRQYAIDHNYTSDQSEFDFDKLREEVAALELQGVDMSYLDGLKEKMEQLDDWFSRENKNDTSREDGNDEYNEFLDKFEQKKTTDDCYTPDNIYEAVAGWVEKEYGVKKSNFVRPFYPGGDYENYQYPYGCVVVDNPPFSILSTIIKFYCTKGIKFFLFAPALTLFTAIGQDVEYMPEGCDVMYENGAIVKTSFINNLGANRIYISSELHEAVEAANDANMKAAHADLPKYNYPDEVIVAGQIQKLAHYGQTLKVSKSECVYQNRLDSQKDAGKEAFGGLFLLSERAAAERAAATKWQLSEREREIVRSLGK